MVKNGRYCCCACAHCATWLLWAEVETGLDGCRWTVANPALQSEQQTH